MKTKLGVLIVAILVSGITLGENLLIPEYIRVRVDEFEGTEFHSHTGFGRQWWEDKITNEWLPANRLSPHIHSSPGGGPPYTIYINLISYIPERLGNPTDLKRFQIKAGSQGAIDTIKFDSENNRSKEYAKYGLNSIMGVALGGGSYCYLNPPSDTSSSASIMLFLMGEDATSFMQKIANQTEDARTTVRFDFDKGELRMDVPLKLSEPIREFYEWAKVFYKWKGLTWPGTEE